MIVLTGPSHPGRVLKDLYLDPLDMSAGALASRIEVPHMFIARILSGDAPMTAELALRLSRYFGNTAEFWMNLQRAYDLDEARQRVDVSSIEPMKVG